MRQSLIDISECIPQVLGKYWYLNIIDEDMPDQLLGRYW